MLISRWQAPKLPTKEQVIMIFKMEGLRAVEEIFQPNTEVAEHKHPLDEVRMIVSGKVLFNIAGNQLLLRSGDRIEIPSNTKHSFKIDGEEPCESIYAQRPF